MNITLTCCALLRFSYDSLLNFLRFCMQAYDFGKDNIDMFNSRCVCIYT